MKISPASSISGSVMVPGDKSISHRAAILAAIAHGETRIENFSTARDCHTTIKCLEQLGAAFTHSGNDLIVNGVGKTGLTAPKKPIDCGNSGTTARLLAGVLAGQPFDSVLTGDASLSMRPMKRIIDPLRQMGAKIEADNGSLPIHIFGGSRLFGIKYDSLVASAQVKSCILLAALFAEGETILRELVPTRDHTERMLRWFGVDLITADTPSGKSMIVTADTVLTARDLEIPADTSSAAFFMVAAACLKGSELIVPNVGINSTRTAFMEVLRTFGADIRISNQRDTCNEPTATIQVQGGIETPSAFRQNGLSGIMIPKIIDEIPILAVLGTQIDCGIEVRAAAELRLKESDRISAIVENLRKMNAVVEEFPDGFKVQRSNLTGAVLNSFGDHRIAMAFAVAGLLAGGETDISNAECVDISFPHFFETLKTIVR